MYTYTYLPTYLQEGEGFKIEDEQFNQPLQAQPLVDDVKLIRQWKGLDEPNGYVYRMRVYMISLLLTYLSIYLPTIQITRCIIIRLNLSIYLPIYLPTTQITRCIIIRPSWHHHCLVSGWSGCSR
jgi:hypothetical protein